MEPIVPRISLLVFAAALALLPACRRAPGAGLVDPDLAACLPSDTLAIAGADLVRLRVSSAWRELPAESAALLDPAAGASYALVAYNGKTVFAAARGDFRQPPAGGVMAAKNIALFGSPEAVRAAQAQRKAGKTGAEWLLMRAEAAAKGSPLWAVVLGGAALPLSGNSANFNQMLRMVDYAAFSAKFDSRIACELTAEARSPEAAQRFEETLRASLSLAAAGLKRDPSAAALLRSVQVRRDGLAVHAAASMAPEQLAAALGAFSR
jgi:hypothetical protein